MNKLAVFRVFTVAAIVASSLGEAGWFGTEFSAFQQLGTSTAIGIAAAIIAKASHLI